MQRLSVHTTIKLILLPKELRALADKMEVLLENKESSHFPGLVDLVVDRFSGMSHSPESCFTIEIVADDVGWREKK